MKAAGSRFISAHGPASRLPHPAGLSSNWPLSDAPADGAGPATVPTSDPGSPVPAPLRSAWTPTVTTAASMSRTATPAPIANAAGRRHYGVGPGRRTGGTPGYVG